MSDLLWTPKHPERSQMWQFMMQVNEHHQLQLADYSDLHLWSINFPELFWPALVDFFNIYFATPANQILNQHQDMFAARWFIGAKFNFAEQLLNRRDAHPALIAVNENDKREVLSYQELYAAVAQCAAGLKALGIGVGDRVAAVMPNIAQTIIAMLATSSIGAIWSSCSPDFGSQAALDRLGQIEPKVLFICDGHQYQGKVHSGAEKIALLCESMPSLKQVVICPNINEALDLNQIPKTIYWNDFLRPATECEFVSLPFDHPLYILFSSGTTGKPKCIVHGAGGTLLQHLKELGLHTDLKRDENMLFYTTCGWMMWNWMVSALALGSTLTLYEGSPSYPETNRLFRLASEEKIDVLGTSAKFISALEKAGLQPGKEFDLSKLRCILSTGSPLLAPNYNYVYEQIKSDVQLSSISGGTDIVSCFALGNPILPVYRGELQCLGLGMAVEVFNDVGEPILETRGELVCTKAFPSMPVSFWNDADGSLYKKAYFNRFPGVWTHGDFAEITQHSGLIIYGRSDAVLNPGGVRIGTAEIYRQVEQIPEVMDSIVIGQEWQDDVRVVLFVKLQVGVALDEALCQRIRQTIKQNASPRHVPAKILQVGDIPRTMSGKIVEIAVRQIVEGHEVSNLQSLANPQALDFFKNRAELKT